MEEGYRSGGGVGHTGDGVVKSRSSTGCLIIKKKVDGVDGVGSSRPPIVYQSKKEKKRLRLMASDSGSSGDEMVQLYRRRGVPGASQVASGSVVRKKGTVEGSDISRKKNKLEYRNHGRTEFSERDRKKSKLDVYEFDEYDDLTDVEMMRMFPYSEREFEGSGRSFLSREPVMTDSSGRKFNAGSSRHSLIESRKRPFPGSRSSGRISRDVDHSFRKHIDLKNEHPSSNLKQKFESSSAEPIRLQGKNGVLKVMVNKKKVGGTYKTPTYEDVRGNSKVSNSLEIAPINTMVHPPFYSEKKPQHKPTISKRTDRDILKSQKSMQKKISSQSSDESDEASDSIDTPSKLPSKTVEVRKSVKKGRGEGGRSLSPESPPVAASKEGKVKRGSGTEKQLLREKIRSMLTGAGWKIDYRPRRNRDYFDAVYINPSGTAYWSIIKAYDAFQKQLEDEGTQARTEGSPFAPISGEVLSKLTRQTRKKIEKEQKQKKKDAEKRRKKAGRAAKFVDDDYDTDGSGNSVHEEKLSSFIKQSGKSSRGRSHEARYNESSSLTAKVQDRVGRCSSASNYRSIHGRKTNKIGRCTLLVRSSDKGVNSDGDDFVPYAGKRTLLSWLIDSGAVKLSEKVQYMNRKRTRIMLEGWINRDGVHCGCCSKILTVSKFEIHAASKLRQPFQNIYLSNSGVSLMQCQVDAWNRQDESHRKGFHAVDTDGEDPNDDTCGICGDGGDLICCDGCPSTFHQTCLDIEMLPAGDWHCPHCSCKFCGGADMSAADGNDRTLGLLQTCSLCERKYHTSCMQGTCAVLTIPRNNIPFCGQSCLELFEQLQKLLGVKHELESGLSWSLIRRTDLDSDSSLRGSAPRVEWNSKLAVALTVMDECFLPIIDRRSGINLIHNVLYNCGSNFNRLNYNGFYTAILERGDEIISAASIRIHGTRLAEMPFIGTRHIYRRQGMCRRLFYAIESALHCLKVEKLIIPAISELMHTWTGLFGFSAIHDSVKQEMKSMNILVFPGIDMLQKELPPQETMNTDEAVVIGKKSSKPDGSNCGLSSGGDAVTASGFCNAETHDKPVSGVSMKQPAVSLSKTSSTSHEDKPDIIVEGNQETPGSRVGLEDKLADPAPEEKLQHASPVSTDKLDDVMEGMEEASSSRVRLKDKLVHPAPEEKLLLSTPVSTDKQGIVVEGMEEAPCSRVGMKEKLVKLASPEKAQLSIPLSTDKQDALVEGIQGTTSSRARLEDKLAEPAPEEKNELSIPVSTDKQDTVVEEIVEAPCSRVGMKDKLVEPAPQEKVQLSIPVSTDKQDVLVEGIQGTTSSRAVLEDKLAEPASEEKNELSTPVSNDVLEKRDSLVNSVADCGEEGTQEPKAHYADSELPPQGISSSKSFPLDDSQVNVQRASTDVTVSNSKPGDESESERDGKHVSIDAGNESLVTEDHNTDSVAEPSAKALAEGEVNHAREIIPRDHDASVVNSSLCSSCEPDEVSGSNVGIVCSSQKEEILEASAGDAICRSKFGDSDVLVADKPQVDSSPAEVNVVHPREKAKGNCAPQELGSEDVNHEPVCDSSVERSD